MLMTEGSVERRTKGTRLEVAECQKVGNDPAALRDAAVSAVRAVVTGNPDQAQEARERAAQAFPKLRTSR
jgi:hypothetical protein